MRRRTTRQHDGQRKADDAVLKVIAETKLDDWDVEIPPDVTKLMLARLVELIDKEAAQRLPGRPRSDRAGQIVAILMQGGASQADARKHVTRMLRKSRDAVARSHNRYRRVGQN